MKITLVAVVSINGKTTKGREGKIHEWTSKEDQFYFYSLIEKSRLVIMGRKTFEVARKRMLLTSKTLRVVLTKNPHKYSGLSVLGQLEFTDGRPKALIRKLESRGYKEAMFVGGEKINTSFFKEKLINEVYLTIEPVIFGSGNNLVLPEKMNIDLRLKNIKRLNKNGTVLLKYSVKYK